MLILQGRHVIGFEVQKVIAAVEAFSRAAPSGATQSPSLLPTGVFGFGEGGLIAMHSAALEPRIRCTVVSGYFQGQQDLLASEPLYRNGTCSDPSVHASAAELTCGLPSPSMGTQCLGVCLTSMMRR